MLKSHLQIRTDDDDEAPEVPEVIDLKERKKETAGEEYEGEHLEDEHEPYVEKEEYIYVAEKLLLRTDVITRLSLLGKTAEGDGYTYLKAVLTNMALTNIEAITYFKHIQYLDVSANKLKLTELQAVTKLPYLVLLQADDNGLKEGKFSIMKYLQVLVLNNNNITSVEDIFQPELSTLEIGFNKIVNLKFASSTPSLMPNIKVLDFRNNMIKDIQGLNFTKLVHLYLGYNKIMSLEWLTPLVTLKILNLRRNPVRLLDGFTENHKDLTYLNLRGCGVRTLKQVKRLKVLPAIETLIVVGCPYMGGTAEDENVEAEEDPELRVEVLAALQRLKRLNKVVVTPEEREEAKNLMLSWLEEDAGTIDELVDEAAEEEARED